MPDSTKSKYYAIFLVVFGSDGLGGILTIPLGSFAAPGQYGCSWGVAWMSRYEYYALASKSYDEARQTTGINILRRRIDATAVALSDICLLDAGCGTDAYSQAMLPHAAHVNAVDLGAGMRL